MSDDDLTRSRFANLVLKEWSNQWHQVTPGLRMRARHKRGFVRAFLAWRRIGYRRDRGAIIRRGQCWQDPLTGEWAIRDFAFDARFADRTVAGLLYNEHGEVERVCGWPLAELARESR
jgi:hypothetical protein